MIWVFIAICLAGFVAGFSAGASPSTTGGSVATGVAAFAAGLVTGIVQTDKINEVQIGETGIMAICFLMFLSVAYVGANILRKNHKLVWMGIQGPGRKP